MLKSFFEDIGFFLTIGLVLTFILIGGNMIGSAVAYSNTAEKNRQIECIDHNGHMEYVNNLGAVCRK